MQIPTIVSRWVLVVGFLISPSRQVDAPAPFKYSNYLPYPPFPFPFLSFRSIFHYSYIPIPYTAALRSKGAIWCMNPMRPSVGLTTIPLRPFVHSNNSSSSLPFISSPAPLLQLGIGIHSTSPCHECSPIGFSCFPDCKKQLRSIPTVAFFFFFLFHFSKVGPYSSRSALSPP